MKTTPLFSRPTLYLAGVLAVIGCDPTPAPPSATQDAPPFFSPVDAGQDAGARDAGTDAGVDAGMTDAGTDGGLDGGSDAGTLTPGITIVSSNNRLPRAWVVSDATKLNRSQPLPTDGGAKSDALLHVGQWVKLDVPTTSNNTMTDEDHCPNVFNNICDGFAAVDTSSNIVLVDAFTLLGSGMSDCAASFNGVALPTIYGVWQGRLNTTVTPQTTSYSMALANCTGLGMGTLYVGTTYAPASTDIQDLQANYPAGKPLVSVHGVVVGVALNQSKLRTMFIQDPVAGPLSGIQVFQSAGLTPTPAVGDYVTVTATADTRGDYNQLVVP